VRCSKPELSIRLNQVSLRSRFLSSLVAICPSLISGRR
jgi:hypothetical protein